MGMNQAFYSGLTGLYSTQFGISTVSNNIANISTTGFKASSTEFDSIYKGSIKNSLKAGPEEEQSGIGTRVAASSVNFDTGTLHESDKNTDLAIAGNGWFGVQNATGISYTKAGDFSFDSQRNLVQPDGSHLLGTLANNIKDGKITQELGSLDLANETSQEPLNFPTALTYPAKATSKVDFFANLGLEDTPRGMSATVVDKDGNKNNLALTFTKAKNQPSNGSVWNLNVIVTSADKATTYDSQDVSTTFDSEGKLESISPALKQMDNNGSKFTINLGSGFSGVTANSAPFHVSNSKSDGIPKGELIDYSIDKDGVISAAFSNSKTSVVGRVALYHFRNDQGLEAISGTHYKESSNSGKAHFWQDSDGKNILGANILTNTLEGSNVKFEVALSELIVMQRAFDANSRSIKTADELIQKALNM